MIERIQEDYSGKGELFMPESRHIQLASQVEAELLSQIRSGKYRTARRLPPELQLAQELSVSRTAVRDALSIMEQEGYVSRRRGTGTIINRHVVNVAVRFDGEEEFLRIVEKSGYAPAVRFLGAEIAPAGDAVAGWLKLTPGSEVLAVGRVITADGIPVIYCMDYIPAQLLRSRDYTERDLREPIFDFLRQFCGIEGCMDLTELHARNAPQLVADALELEPGTAVLNFDEVWYDFDGNPILYADEFYREGMITHTILRKRQEKY